MARDEQQIREMNHRLEQLVKLTQRNYEKEDRTLERVINLLHKDRNR